MHCPVCGTENAEGSFVCRQCGEDLANLGTAPATGTNTGAGESSGDSRERESKAFPVSEGETVPEDGDPTPLGRLKTIVWDGNAPEYEAPGQQIGDHYEIIARLGSGGMGVTYRVRDTRLERDVAVKRLRAPDTSAQMGIQRFLMEARAIAALNHRNIVTIHELGEDDRGPFIVMEYLTGGDLRLQIRRRGKLPVPEVLETIRAVGQGLAYAHRRNVVHRDIKPSNILLDEEGVPKLVDFGLAKMTRESDLSVTGQSMGTHAYMAPEQRRDAKHVDHRCDIYGLAKTLYHMATGEVPDPVDLDLLPAAVRPAVKHALKPKPEDRPFSVEEFLEELAQPIKAATAARGDVPMREGECPNCGRLNPERARFCERCGTGLFDKCPKCGNEFRAGLQHCGICGTHIHRYTEAKDALAKARDHLAERRFGRAIKSARIGLDAGYFRQELQQVHDEADNLLTRLNTLREEADRLANREEYEQAEATLREALEIDPAHEEVTARLAELPQLIRARDLRRLLEEAEALENEGKLEQAVQTFRQALELDPADEAISARLDEVTAALNRRRAAEAVDEADRLIGAERYEEAEARLREAVELDPECGVEERLEKIPVQIRDREVRRHRRLAEALLEQGRYEQAMQAIEEALRLDGLRADLREMRTEALARWNNHRVAPLLEEADRLAAEGRFGPAEKRLREALEIDPDRQDIADRLGALPETERQYRLRASLAAAREALRDRRFRDALNACHETLQLDASCGEAQKYMGEAQSQADDHRARQARAAALRDEGDYAAATDILKSLCSDFAWDESLATELRHCESLRAEAEKRFAASCERARAHERRGALKAALGLWGELVEQHPRRPEPAREKLRVEELLKRRRRRWTRVGILAAGLAVIVAVAAWAGWDNQAHLVRASRLAEEGNFAAAVAELEACGWFWSWGRSRVREDVDEARFDWHIAHSAESRAAGRFAQAAASFQEASQIRPDSVEVAHERKNLVAAWKRSIIELADRQFWDQVEREAKAAVRTFPQDADFARFGNLDFDSKPTKAVDLGDGVTLAFVLIPSGRFQMGSPAEEAWRAEDEGPRREVEISRPFYLSATEVTQDQYRRIMGENPSVFNGGDLPVEQVSWHAAREFCARLSRQCGLTARLPTEAEWEYACRAGTETPFHTGEALTPEQANFDPRDLGDAARDAADLRTVPVGSFPPNAWKLHDMHGNVYEWCSDWYAPSYAESETVDPTGPKTGTERVLRGGSYRSQAWNCRSAYRFKHFPEIEHFMSGLRVVLELDSPASQSGPTPNPADGDAGDISAATMPSPE